MRQHPGDGVGRAWGGGGALSGGMKAGDEGMLMGSASVSWIMRLNRASCVNYGYS